MLELGWNPPVADAPNYQFNLESLDWRIVASRFIDALEQGIGIHADEVSKLTINIQGKGQY